MGFTANCINDAAKHYKTHSYFTTCTHSAPIPKQSSIQIQWEINGDGGIRTHHLLTHLNFVAEHYLPYRDSESLNSRVIIGRCYIKGHLAVASKHAGSQTQLHMRHIHPMKQHPTAWITAMRKIFNARFAKTYQSRTLQNFSVMTTIGIL